MVEERRKHGRLPITLPAYVRMVAEEETFTPFQYRAQVMNISASGVLISIDEIPTEQYEILFRRPRYLRIICKFPDSDEQTLLFGRVIWHEYSAEDQSALCRAAVEFDPLSAEDKKRLEQFLLSEGAPK